MSKCIFCNISKSKIPSYTLYNDEKTFAFLDVSPLSKGHTLVIPKKHKIKFEDLEEDDGVALFRTVYKIVKILNHVVKSQGSTIAINNGKASGQEVPHVHVHVIPRFLNDGGYPIHEIIKKKPYINENELNKITNLSQEYVQSSGI